MNHYQRLGVDRNASAAAIKTAYRSKVRKLHPDVTGEDPDKAQEFQEVVRAYEVLSDEETRARYDATLSSVAREQARSVLEHFAGEAVGGIATAASETINAKLGEGSKLGKKAAKASGALLDVGREWCQQEISRFFKKL